MTPFRTPFNYVPEIPVQSQLPSMTEPDQTLTLREMLTRYAQGKPLSKNRLAFHGDEIMPDIRTLDMEEIVSLRLDVDERINNLNAKIAEKIEKQRAAQRKAAEQKPDEIGEGTKLNNKGE